MYPKNTKQSILVKNGEQQAFRTDPKDSSIMWICRDFESGTKNSFAKCGIQHAMRLWDQSITEGWDKCDG